MPHQPQPARQPELVFDEARPWQRSVREPSRAYFAFTIFRDLGPARTQREAYRRYLQQYQNKLDLGEQVEVSSSFRRWTERYRWVERAQAYDDAIDEELRTRHQAMAWEEIKRRFEERLQCDKLMFQAILDLYQHIARLLAAASLGTTEQWVRYPADKATGAQKGGSTTTDAAEVLERASRVLLQFEAQYFACLKPAEQEGEQSAAPLTAASFTWKPDPEMAENIRKAEEVARDLAAVVQAQSKVAAEVMPPEGSEPL